MHSETVNCTVKILYRFIGTDTIFILEACIPTSSSVTKQLVGVKYYILAYPLYKKR